MKPTPPEIEHRFWWLVERLRAGVSLPRSVVDAILGECGRTDRQLVDAMLLGSPHAAPRPGDDCQCGGGHLVVVNSFRRGDRQVQYLGCSVCGARPARNKRIIPVDSIRRRQLRNLTQFGLPSSSPTANNATNNER